MTYLEPMSKRILVEMLPKGERMEKGIILDKPDLKRYDLVKVLSVGPEVLNISPGDEIMIDFFSAMKLESDDGRVLLMVKLDEVLGIKR